MIIEKINFLEIYGGRHRSSHWTCCLKKDVLKNFANFTEKSLVLKLLFDKVASLQVIILNIFTVREGIFICDSEIYVSVVIYCLIFTCLA